METDDRWADAQRLEGWAGEIRVNLIRFAAITAFYGNHLLQVYLFRDQGITPVFHAGVTVVALTWAVAALALHGCLWRHWVPPALKYVATACDILLVTTVLMLSGDPRTTLAVLYFLVIAAAPLRLSLPLVTAATLGSMTAYLFFLGYLRFGLHLADAQRLSRPQQIIFLLA